MPPPSPTTQFSQLSIESMPPTTRLQSSIELDDSSTESEGKSRHSELSDQADSCIRFPSRLIYSLENLDDHVRQHVAHAMEEPPQIVLRVCRARDNHVIFQVSELVQFDIRTGSKDSEWEVPSCSCGDDSPSRTPCRHILWLFDQITSQVFDNRGEVLSLNKNGYSDLLQNPYDTIQKCHLDILADDLHSRVFDTASEADDTLHSPRRVQEAREILASLNRIPIDEYRPDIFENPTAGKRVVKRRDLECTIFRMLCQNNEFFQYFLSCMKSDEPVNNTFRKLQKRADAALAGLDAYERNASDTPEENPKDVKWCATHLRIIVQKIQTALLRTRRPLEPWERQAAARTLIHILREVVNRSQDLPLENVPRVERNLYLNLIGDQDRNFAIGALNSLAPDAINPLADDLERIIFDIGKPHGVPLTYVEKLRAIHQRARKANTVGSPSGSKRRGGGQGGRVKRVK